MLTLCVNGPHCVCLCVCLSVGFSVWLSLCVQIIRLRESYSSVQTVLLLKVNFQYSDGQQRRLLCAQNYPRWQHSCKGAEPHQMAALWPSHVLLFIFSTAMLLALFHSTSICRCLCVPVYLSVSVCLGRTRKSNCPRFEKSNPSLQHKY